MVVPTLLDVPPCVEPRVACVEFVVVERVAATLLPAEVTVAVEVLDWTLFPLFCTGCLRLLEEELLLDSLLLGVAEFVATLFDDSVEQ